jgi:hypothetical protein
LAQPTHGSTKLATRAQAARVLIYEVIHARDQDTPTSLGLDLHDIPLAQPSLAEGPDRDRDLMLAGDPGTTRTAPAHIS